MILSLILQNNQSEAYGHLRIASIKSIFTLKSLLLLDRNKIRDLYDIVYLLKNQNFTAKEMIDIIMHYRITYLQLHILQLIEAKKEDPYDIEGIEKPRMDITEYENLKAYLLEDVKANI